MQTDRYGLDLSTGSGEARDAYVDAIDRMLAAHGGVEDRLGEAIAADPNFAMAHVAMARQHQLMARGAEARHAAETAVGLLDGVSERERGHIEILADVVSGRIPSSLERTRSHLEHYPRDAFALSPACGVFGSIGFSGRVDREPEQLALLEPLAEAYGEDWWFLTVHAFALLEMGRWEQGRALAERSLEIKPDNSHGAHTLAHALYEGGADDVALAFLGQWLDSADPASLMHCHNWWHYSLLLLGADRHDEARDAFGANCLPGTNASPTINVVTDSASFLWRAELAGVPRDDAAWESVRVYYEENFRRPIVFVDAHAGLPYAALGRTEDLVGCIEQLQELGEQGKLPAGTLGATLNTAWQAFTAEQWSSVIGLLEPVMSEVVRIGGSRAQRDMVVNTLIAALVADGRPGEAAAVATAVGERQPNRPIANFSAG